MASLLNDGILMDIKKYFKDDFEKAYESVKDIEVNDETIHYLIGYMSKESTFYRDKELYQTDDENQLKRLGKDICSSILRDLYTHTDSNNFTSSYDSKFFLFYFLNRSSRLIPSDVIYKKPSDDLYLLFADSIKEKEHKYIEKGMHKAYKEDITKYGPFPIKLPTGILLDKTGMLYRTEEKVNKLEFYYQGIYHTIMVHDFFMSKLVQSKNKKKETVKLFIPILNANRHYLNKYFSNKKPTAENGTPLTKKMLNAVAIQETLNDFDFTSVYDAPFFKMYKTKNDIKKDFVKDKKNVLFILELEVKVEDIIFEGTVELYSSSVDVCFVKDSSFIKTKNVIETNITSLYGRKNPKALHYLDYNQSATYHLKEQDVWILLTVDKKTNSTTNKSLFKLMKPLNDLSQTNNPKNSQKETIISPLYTVGYLGKKEFEENFGFNPLPSLTKIEKEVDLFVIDVN